jgi:hypothetical protein
LEKTTTKVIDHILSQGYFVTTNEPTDQERATYPKNHKKLLQMKVE